MTSPVGSFVSSILAQVSAGSEFATQVDNDQRKNLLRAIFDAYYRKDQDKDVIFDTNRMWSAKLPTLIDMFPDAKVIACVRNMAWVMDSIERQFRSNPYEYTKLFGNNMARSTVYQRLEGLAQYDQLVGFAWAALREGFYGEHAQSILVIDYDLLTQAPDKVMGLLYDFIGEPRFDHNFNEVVYDAPDFDLQLGVPGLHRVRSVVKFEQRQSIIPPDLFEKYSKMNFWQETAGSAANVIAPKPDNKVA